MRNTWNDYPETMICSRQLKEACRASNSGRTTLYAHIRSGRLEALKAGGTALILAACSDELTASNPVVHSTRKVTGRASR
jgi:hypothetical protein